MQVIKINAEITQEQLYSLLLQLSIQERLNLAKKLRADACAESLRALGKDLPDVEISMDEIVAEIKTVRHENSY